VAKWFQFLAAKKTYNPSTMGESMTCDMGSLIKGYTTNRNLIELLWNASERRLPNFIPHFSYIKNADGRTSSFGFDPNNSGG